jgi:predicted nucleic acid-binding protein
VIVADTNLLLYLFVAGDFTRPAEEVFGKDPEWVAPPLWRSEFRSALVVYIRRGRLGLHDAMDKASAAEALMEGRDFEVDSARVLRLAAVSGCSAYDCEFVALAQDLGVSLVTADKKLLSTFRGTAVSMREFCS